MGAQENESQILQNYILHMNFQKFTGDIPFLRLPWEIALGVITDD